MSVSFHIGDVMQTKTLNHLSKCSIVSIWIGSISSVYALLLGTLADILLS